MSTENETVPQSTKSRRNRWDPLVDSERRKFRVQSTPPLSLRQFLRSTITVVPGGNQWKPSGTYHAPLVYENPPIQSPYDLPTMIMKPRKNSRPAWYPSGPMKYKRPQSPNKNNNEQKSRDVENNSRSDQKSNVQSKVNKKPVTPWRPGGKLYHESVPYFDSPSLRWSPEQVRKFVPEFKQTTKNSPTVQK